MHELGIMTGVIEAAEKAARDSGATRLLKVNLSIGEMTEAIEDALVFAWEALTEDDPYAKGAELTINMIKPKSRCLECGAVFEHEQRRCTERLRGVLEQLFRDLAHIVPFRSSPPSRASSTIVSKSP